MLITLYKIGGVHFRVLGTNGFRVKAKKERFTAASSRCRQNFKYENFPSLLGKLRQNTAPKSVPHGQHDYFSSFNQSNHWFVALSLTLPLSDLKHGDGDRKSNLFPVEILHFGGKPFSLGADVRTVNFPLSTKREYIFCFYPFPFYHHFFLIWFPMASKRTRQYKIGI